MHDDSAALTWEDVRDGLRWQPAFRMARTRAAGMILGLPGAFCLLLTLRAIAAITWRPDLFLRDRSLPIGELIGDRPAPWYYRWNKGVWWRVAEALWRLVPDRFLGGPVAVKRMSQELEMAWQIERSVSCAARHARALRRELRQASRATRARTGKVNGADLRLYTGIMGHLASYGGRTPKECGEMIRHVLPDGPVKVSLVAAVNVRLKKESRAGDSWEAAKTCVAWVVREAARVSHSRGEPITEDLVWELVDSWMRRGDAMNRRSCIAPKVARLMNLRWPRPETRPSAPDPTSKPEPAGVRTGDLTEPKLDLAPLPLLRGVRARLRQDGETWTGMGECEGAALPLRVDSVQRVGQEWFAVAESLATRPGVLQRVALEAGRLSCGHEVTRVGVPMAGGRVACADCGLEGL